MFEFAYRVASETLGLSGFNSHIAASLIVTVAVSTFVIIIGWLVNNFESFQMRCLRKVMSRKAVIFVCNYVTIVGTVFHELAHAFMAWSMGAKVQEIRVLEIRDDNRLGHVSFRPNGSKFMQKVQITCISCAPVLSGLLWVYILLKALQYGDLSIGWQIVTWYYIISIIDHMSMSEVDIKNYLHGLFRVAPVMFMFSWVIIYLFVAR